MATNPGEIDPPAITLAGDEANGMGAKRPRMATTRQGHMPAAAGSFISAAFAYGP